MSIKDRHSLEAIHEAISIMFRFTEKHPNPDSFYNTGNSYQFLNIISVA
jgi:hypothetical protein